MTLKGDRKDRYVAAGRRSHSRPGNQWGAAAAGRQYLPPRKPTSPMVWGSAQQWPTCAFPCFAITFCDHKRPCIDGERNCQRSTPLPSVNPTAHHPIGRTFHTPKGTGAAGHRSLFTPYHANGGEYHRGILQALSYDLKSQFVTSKGHSPMISVASDVAAGRRSLLTWKTTSRMVGSTAVVWVTWLN